MRTNQIILIIATLLFALCSCQDDCSKADKLRLQNKFEEAVELYQKAADEGNAYAKWRLSKAYGNGDGVDFDEHRAAQLLVEAAEGNCDEAKCDLAFAYLFDWYDDLGKDVEKGKQMIESLAKKTDNSYALSRYASLFFFGSEPYDEDKEKAINILEKVKDKNDPFYLEMMGDVFMNGTDKIDINETKALEFYTKAFEKGRKGNAWDIATMYLHGKGNITKDRAKAIEWANRGIESNVTNCMGLMASLYLNINEDSLLNDIQHPQKGLELLKKAAKHGNGDAYTFLGQLYFYGKYVEKDDKKSFDYITKATDLKSSQGAFLLGLYYVDGIGCEKDIQKGIETWKKAVEYGDGGAANNLFCYYQGSYGGKIDKEKARTYLQKAADLGDNMACFNLGKEYYYGNNLMKKNEDQAFVYIKKAADQGLVDACSWLSFFYDKGIGCNRDPEKAKEYKDKTVAKEDKKEEK